MKINERQEEHMEHVINLLWDIEAGVWIATSDTLTGLILESASLDELIERVKLASHELLSLTKGKIPKATSLCFKIRCDRIETIEPIL
jgi:hypothetical protein